MSKPKRTMAEIRAAKAECIVEERRDRYADMRDVANILRLWLGHKAEEGGAE